MTHQPLTKAEREELQNRHRFQSDPDSRDINRLLADLDAAEADVVSMRNEGEEMAGQVMQRFAELEAQRDRAESELDAERRMRVEAEAAAKRAEEERVSHDRWLYGKLREIFGDGDLMLDLARKAVAERAALKAKLAALVEAVSDVCSRGMPGGDSDSAITIYKVEALLRAAIAAARGGES